MPNTSRAISGGISGAGEGDAFPPRTIELLKQVDAALFGAIHFQAGHVRLPANLHPRCKARGWTTRTLTR